MATSTGQRVGIWVIAGALVIGTVGGFLAMILSSDNDAKTQQVLAEYQAAYAEYQKETTKQEDDVKARTQQLSDTYYAQFSSQKSKVKTFSSADVKELSTSTINDGDGVMIKDDSTYLAYYIGFTPDGKIFDSSLEEKSLKQPLIVRPSGVIAGWAEGMKGKKIGGVYQLTIPSDRAYGEAGSGESIPPNTPLTFVVMPIEILKTVTEPQISEEVINAYGTQY